MEAVTNIADAGWPRRIILHGEMAARFGPEMRLDVETPAEAVRAIQANRPEFYAYLRDATDRGVGFVVLLRDNEDEDLDGEAISLSEKELLHPIGNRTLEFVPTPMGAGDSGFVQIILGVVLIVIGLLLLLTPFAEFAPYVITLGVGFVLGGAAALLTPTPKIDTGLDDRDQQGGQQRKSSYFFSGPVNTTGQGLPIPLGYGLVLTGSHIVSAGLRNIEQGSVTGVTSTGDRAATGDIHGTKGGGLLTGIGRRIIGQTHIPGEGEKV